MNDVEAIAICLHESVISMYIAHPGVQQRLIPSDRKRSEYGRQLASNSDGYVFWSEQRIQNDMWDRVYRPQHLNIIKELRVEDGFYVIDDMVPVSGDHSGNYETLILFRRIIWRLQFSMTCTLAGCSHP